MINLITTIQLADFICTTTKSMAHGISIIDLEVKMHGTTAIQILRIRVPLGKMTHGGNGKMINGFKWKTSVFMLHKLCLLLANRYGNSEFNKINLYRKKTLIPPYSPGSVDPSSGNYFLSKAEF